MSGIIPTNFVSTSIALYIITLSSRGILHYRKKTINTILSLSRGKNCVLHAFKAFMEYVTAIQEVSIPIECLVLYSGGCYYPAPRMRERG